MTLVMTLVKKLYELQQIDLEIQRNQETLDEINRQLGETEALLQARAKLFAEEKHLAEIDKQQKGVEWEIEDLRNSITSLNEKLYGGKVGNPKELVSLEHELEIFKSKLMQKEDNLLDLMTEAEVTQDRIKVESERLGQIERDWQQEQEALGKRQSEVEGYLSDIGQERQAVASEVTPQTLELYEGVKSKKGQAVAKVEQGRCQGCRLNLPINEWQRARVGDVVQCSSCGSILYLG